MSRMAFTYRAQRRNFARKISREDKTAWPRTWGNAQATIADIVRKMKSSGGA